MIFNTSMYASYVDTFILLLILRSNGSVTTGNFFLHIIKSLVVEWLCLV
jgi:hypothetical protein